MRLHIMTVDGSWHESDFIDMTDPEACGLSNEDAETGLFELIELLKNFKSIGNLNILVNGRKRFFNPGNIVCASINMSLHEKSVFPHLAKELHG